VWEGFSSKHQALGSLGCQTLEFPFWKSLLWPWEDCVKPVQAFWEYFFGFLMLFFIEFHILHEVISTILTPSIFSDCSWMN
jgi:hypothetical protein